MAFQIGNDLSTTFLLISYLNSDGRPVIIPQVEGSVPIPYPFSSSNPNPFPVGGDGSMDDPTAQPNPISEPPIIVQSTARSFGIEVVDLELPERPLYISNIIGKFSQLPAEVTIRFKTLEPEQESMEIKIVENFVLGARATIDESRPIAQTVLTLGAGLPAGSPVDVTFKLDESGLLHATAFDPIRGQNIVVDVVTVSTLPEPKEEELRSHSRGISPD